VSVRCKTEREIAIPTLRASDRVGIETVVDEADPHSVSREAMPFIVHADCKKQLFAASLA
jgi:hypothetical protein